MATKFPRAQGNPLPEDKHWHFPPGSKSRLSPLAPEAEHDRLQEREIDPHMIHIYLKYKDKSLIKNHPAFKCAWILNKQNSYLMR